MKVAKHTTPNNGSLMNWIFDDVFMRDSFNGVQSKKENTSKPKTNIIETEKSFKLELAAPGYNKEEFSIDIENKNLKISGKKKSSKEKINFRMKEFESNSFERIFALSENTDIENINAEYTNGILHITLPKKELERKSLEIKIK